MKYGYARVSDDSVSLTPQIDLLIESGVDANNIYMDVVCRVNDPREGYDDLMSILSNGDEVYVTKADRIAKSLIHYCKLVESLYEKDVRISSLTEPFIETIGDDGEFVYDILKCLANIDRGLVMERTNYGLVKSKTKWGRKGGRPDGLSNSAKLKASLAKTLYTQHKDEMTIEEMMVEIDVKSKATFYKYLEHAGVDIKKK